jgi:Fic family protein
MAIFMISGTGSLLYMSAFFEANKNNYYQKLMQVRMNNELLDWLLFFLKGVEQTAKHSIEILNDALDLKTNFRTRFKEITNWAKIGFC